MFVQILINYIKLYFTYEIRLGYAYLLNALKSQKHITYCKSLTTHNSYYARI